MTKKEKFEKIMGKINLIIIILFVLLNLLISGIFNKTFVQDFLLEGQETILELKKAYTINIKKTFESVYTIKDKGINELIPKNYDKNIIIILDNYRSIFNYHGISVYNSFIQKYKNNEDYKIIKLNTNLYLKKLDIYLSNQDLVGIMYDELKNNRMFINKEIGYFNKYDLIEHIIQNNPKANIIINNSMFNIKNFLGYKSLLENYPQINITQALPYDANMKNKDLIEFLGNIFDVKHERLLYITRCGEYQPSFSDNVRCSKDLTTSLAAPILGYEYFKK